MGNPDPYDLSRFVTVQAPVYETVCEELGRGCKTSHWMWLIFPQIAGLGFSTMSQKYAISGLDEAQAHLAHAVLGPRLTDCTQLVPDVDGKSALQQDAPELSELITTERMASAVLFVARFYDKKV
jgi:uncharacterized protein (DUF1810 family)